MAGIILLISVVVIIFIFIPHKQSADDYSGVNAELIQQNELLYNGAKPAIFLFSDDDHEEMDGWTFETENGETLVFHRVASSALIGAHDSNGQARLVRGARYLLVRQDKN